MRNIGREHPTMLITSAHEPTTKHAYIGGFHLNALSSGLPLKVDLDTTLTVIAGNLYRLLARQLTPC